jgi:hypothetical protein
MKRTLNNKVRPTINVDLVYESLFQNAQVYTDTVINEEHITDVPSCFKGALYRKVYSPLDFYLGIEETFIVPSFTPDNSRFGSDKRVSYRRYLDNPSIYQGGNSYEESDCGICLQGGYLEKSDTYKRLNYGSPKICFRPFYRYIYNKVVDINMNVTRSSVNSWNVSDPTNFSAYYFPGDKIKMTTFSPLPNYLQLRVEILNETKDKDVVEIRRKQGYVNKVYYSKAFYSKGHGIERASFKRVNSIDQYANEGINATITKASVSPCIIQSTYLFRRIDNKIVRVPLTQARSMRIACPEESHFILEEYNINSGGEIITIYGDTSDNK